MHESASRDDPVHSKDRLDEWLDDALADTFPASDPVASPPSDTELAGSNNRPAPDQASGAALRRRSPRTA